MKFLDAAYYGSTDTWNAVMDHEGADDFAYYVGGDYALHAWLGADVIALRTSTRRGMGIHVSSVFGRDGAADGAYFAAWNKNAYGAGDGDRFCFDLEPGIFRQDPATCLAYGKAWAQAVRQVAAVAELAPVAPVPLRRVTSVLSDRVILECGHVLLRHRRRESGVPYVGEVFPCHDCAMGRAA